MLKDVMEACLSFGTRFYTLAQVSEVTGMDHEMARHRLWKLEAAGMITRIDSRDIPAERGRPTKDISYRNTSLLTERFNRVPKPFSGRTNGWDKMWQAIRVLRRCTRRDLAVVCGQHMENVRMFTREYRQRGYLRCLGRSGTRDALWVLVKDPGPRRPVGKEKAHVD